MKRTKAWWRRLNKTERIQLVALEKAANRFPFSQDPNLPDGYGECGMCSMPTSGTLCNNCCALLDWILDKAEGKKVQND